MKRNLKRAVSFVISVMMLVSLGGCKKSDIETNKSITESPAVTKEATAESEATAAPTEAAKGEPTIIRWGWHNMKSFDPYKVDETTGEYTMDEASRQAALAALDKVKQELNVEVEFVEYTQDVRNELITSVLAGDPICDIACLWGGSESTILAQNILQELDSYEDMFKESEDSWMWYDKLYGHNYFFSWKQPFFQRWPLVYNISMIEKVDSLKDENGKTIYPTDLFFDGKWTWSTYQDYLDKIKTYYANVAAPDACVYDNIQAYETDYRFSALSATYAAGGSIYGASGLEVTSEANISAAKYIKELIDKKILTDPGVYSDGYIPVWTKAGEDFQNGGTVFTDCPDWWIKGSGSAAADRGESIGIVAWPRPDDMTFDDENYRQVVTVGDSAGILKGVDEETTKLALEFWKLYWKTYYEVYGNVTDITKYKEENAAAQAAAYGLDIFNENCGEDILESFKYIASKAVGNDYSDLIGVRGTWDVVLGKGFYGIDGMASYDVAIQANINQFNEVIKNMESILASDEVKDNMAPSLTANGTLAFPAGTDVAKLDFPGLFTSEDAIDGVLDTKTGTFDASKVDFSKPGTYKGGLVASIVDKSGNVCNKNLDIIIYDANNTTPPVITLVENYRTINIDEDTSVIKWSGDFVASAADKDGNSVASNIVADLTQLDTTTPGEYEVALTVTDYAGNQIVETIIVQVKAAEE